MTEEKQQSAESVADEGVCGFCHPPPDDSHDREQLDRFSDFLRLVGKAPRDAEGRYIIGERAMRYAQGEDIAPVDPAAHHDGSACRPVGSTTPADPHVPANSSDDESDDEERRRSPE